MRKVFGSHAQTAHIWAQNTQDDGRASDGRMFFEHGTMYSYGHHFAIASHVKDLKDSAAILFTTSRYSVSTGKHISLVKRALRPDVPVFYVPHANGDTDKNLRAFDQQIQNKIENYGAPRIRQSTRDKIAGEIEYLIGQRNLFGQAFVKKYVFMNVPDDIATLAADMALSRARAAKIKEREQAKKLEADTKRVEVAVQVPRAAWADVWRMNGMGDLPDAYAYSNFIENWLGRNVGVLLRCKDNKTIVTSLRAEFPIAHAKKAFEFILKVKGGILPWGKNGKTIHLGHFQLDSIATDGTVKAGCHTVQWDEIALMAERLGWV